MIVAKRILALGCLTLGLSSETWAVPVLWFSDTTAPTAITNPTIFTSPGGTADLYLFASLGATEKIIGLGLSITNTIPGIASGTLSAADWANPEFGLPAKKRWDTNSGTGLAFSFTPGQLTPSMNAVAVTTHGLDGALSAIDPTLNVATGGYLVGKFTVTGVSEGTTPVFLGIGPSLIAGSGFSSVNFGAADASAVSPGTLGAMSTVRDATITVIPEPSSLIIVGSVLTVLCILRLANQRFGFFAYE